MNRARILQLAGALSRAKDGSAAVETAFILPVLVVLTLGTIEFGRIAWTQTSLNFAVMEAARCAAVRPDICGTPSQTAAYAPKRVSALYLPTGTFTVTTPACGTLVRADVDHRFAAYAVFGMALRLTAQACRA